MHTLTAMLIVQGYLFRFYGNAIVWLFILKSLMSHQYCLYIWLTNTSHLNAMTWLLIHSFIFSNHFILLRVMVDANSSQGPCAYIHTRKHSHTHSHTRGNLVYHLPESFWEVWRNMENTEETHLVTLKSSF